MTIRKAIPAHCSRPRAVGAAGALFALLLAQTTVSALEPPYEPEPPPDKPLGLDAGLSVGVTGHTGELGLGSEDFEARNQAHTGARMAWWLAPTIAAELELRLGQSVVSGFKGAQDTVGYRAQALIAPVEFGAWRPFVMIGYGADRLLTQGTGFGKNNGYAANHLGLGLRHLHRQDMGWRVDARAGLTQDRRLEHHGLLEVNLSIFMTF